MPVSYSVNDLESSAWTKRVTTAGANITSGNPVRIMAIGVAAGAGASHVICFNSTTQSGTDNIQVNAGANAYGFIDLGPNGTRFDTGLSISQSGVDTFQVFYLEED
jgi:hypothetical protein